MKAPDYYLILGVRNDADEVVITAAYRALVKKYHPDTAAFTGPKNTEQFRLVQEAYEILRDGEKRRKYDEKLTPDYGQRTSTSNPKKANTKDAAPQTQNGKYKNPTTSQKSKIEPDDLTSVHFTKGLLKLEIFIDFCLKLSLVMTGLWLWSVGDRKGEQYNFWIVMAGWVCILYGGALLRYRELKFLSPFIIVMDALNFISLVIDRFLFLLLVIGAILFGVAIVLRALTG